MINKYTYSYILISLLAFILRFWKLGVVPPSDGDILYLRILTAFVASITIPSLMVLIKNTYSNKSLAMLSGFWLAINPWHIEQSRIYSVYVPILFTLIIIANIWQKFKSNWSKVIIIISVLAVSLIFLAAGSIKLNIDLSAIKILQNLFELLSFEFLFYKNDSFWSGGIREFGVMLPETIPIFLVGIFTLFSKFKKNISMICLILLFAFISSFQKSFPESRIFFLSLPVFMFILALGSMKLFRHLFTRNILIRMSIFAYLLVLIYGISQFMHYYYVHYNLRIYQEKPYEGGKF